MSQFTKYYSYNQVIEEHDVLIMTQQEFLQNKDQIPFEIKSVQWIYDVPGGQKRGGVAYENSEEFIVAMSGSFDVIVDTGNGKKIFPLNRSHKGLYIPKGVWRELDNYSSNSVALIAASTHYDENVEIRDYNEFLRFFGEREQLFRLETYAKSEEKTISQSDINYSYSIYDCSILELNKHHSINNGNLSVVENGKTLPFDIKRIYYLYDVPGGEGRGGHAHKKLWQLIIAASGAFTVTLDDGQVKRSFLLNHPYQGLLVTPGIWRDLTDFSSGAVCMVLASNLYMAEDYIRNYDDFLKYRSH